MSSYLSIPIPEPGEYLGAEVEVRFDTGFAAARCLLVHWSHPELRFVDCEPPWCVYCLAGDRVFQRYSMGVIAEGSVKVLEAPFGLYRVIHHRAEADGDDFPTNTYLIRRSGHGPRTQFSIKKKAVQR